MDTAKLLILSITAASLLQAAPDAKSIYEHSVKMFSFPKIKFQVHSKMQSGEYVKEQRFSVARLQKGDEISSLVCFLAPKNIKQTAMLFKKEGQKRSTLVYFPSIGRTRVIPKSEENNEAFGLGLSFAELQNDSENIRLLKEDPAYYIIERKRPKNTTRYKIEKRSGIVQSMTIFQDGKLTKRVKVLAYMPFEKSYLITKWQIEDIPKKRTTIYTVDTSSITQKVSPRVFRRSSLTHCRP